MAATLRVRFTTDAASDTTPTWTDVTTQVRSFSTRRGRENELGNVEAGTATVVVNNRTQQFDPTDDPLIRPLNRWEIKDTITGELVFLGYATTYTQSWPAPGVDAVTTVELVDEMMVLSMDALPVMDPQTASTYADVVAFDTPQGYWQFQGTNEFTAVSPTVGSTTLVSGTQTRVSSPIVGDDAVENISGVLYGARSTTLRFYSITSLDLATPGLEVGGPGDAAGLTAFTFETWFKSSEATPAATRAVFTGPGGTGAAPQYGLLLNTDGSLRFYVRDATPTLYDSFTSVGFVTADTWYHVALVVTASTVDGYVNGVLVATDSKSGSPGTMAGGGYMYLGETPAPGGTRYFDELAFYRYAVPVARLLAHYQAGALRGFANQAPEDRCTAVMAASSSIAGENFNSTIGREMLPAFQHGQSPLEELRRAETAEQGFLFISKDGIVTMLQSGYQGVSPYNSVQATFDDNGTGLKYRNVEMDYSSTFLYNEIITSREGGTTFTESDATSISTYYKRTLTIPALPITVDGDADAIAQNLLAAYKDPMNRIVALTVDTSSQAVANAVLPLDLGDLIEVNLTQPNGGRIQQQLHVQKIEVSGTPNDIWQIRLGVSPL